MKTYTGIDYHKRYSVACKVDAQGNKIQEAKIEANAPEAFAAYFARLEEPSELVIEACWNWATLYDVLEETPGVSRVVLSHPAKNRIIADAQIKNDRIDARALATLLRGDFVAKVHVPSVMSSTQKRGGYFQVFVGYRIPPQPRSSLRSALPKQKIMDSAGDGL